MKRPRAPRGQGRLPTREDLARFLAEHPGPAGKREILRAFGLGPGDRAALKALLAELEADGTLTRARGRRYTPPGALPEVTVLEIVDVDTDGELFARPRGWPAGEEAPRIVVAPPDGRTRDTGPALGPGDRILARLKKDKAGYVATLMKRLGASAHHVLGVLARVGGELRVRPVDRRSKLELVVDRAAANGAREGELVLVEPLPGRALGLPRARVAERLGSLDSPGVISLIAVHAHGIPTRFPDEVLAEAEAITPASPHGREDLRALPLVTIDPVDARDHDDAVWAGPDDDPRNPGGVIAMVAIADVAAYVRPGSAIDREAVKRGNSVYFPDRVEPMLPERLSTDLCSLKEGVDRPCLAVRMVFDADGRKKNQRFVRGLMRSAARLTYQQAQAAFDGRPDAVCAPLMDAVLRPLWQAYGVLARGRDARAPLDLDLPEHRIELGPDGRIARISLRERLESMRLIEEFMIQANVAAAETLEARRTPLIYRIHDEPSREKLEGLSAILESVGQSFAKGQALRPAVFNRILARVRETAHAPMVNEVVLRAQAQAEYNAENIGHFGLNLLKYAHFTSPIRRYADLIVHRALIRALKLGDDGLSDAEIPRLAQIAADISATERRAMAAERDSKDRYMAAYMQDRLGAEFEGRISGVTRFGVFVRLQETGADGLVPVRALGNEYFHHDEASHALIGERTGLAFRLGAPVRVKLMEAAPVTGGLRFEILEGGEIAAAPGRTRRKPARTAARKSAGKTARGGSRPAGKRR